MANRTSPQITSSLENAVKVLAAAKSSLGWDGSDGMEALLKREGFSHMALQMHQSAIKKLYLTARQKHDANQIYPSRSAPPPSPPHSEDAIPSGSNSASQGPPPSPAARPQDQVSPRCILYMIDANPSRKGDLPRTVHVHIEGDIYDPVHCVHNQDRDESLISYDLLENKRMTGRIDNSRIRLVWKGNWCDKTTTTLFRVVKSDEIESCDIDFGRMWLKGLPRKEVPFDKKRKGFAGWCCGPRVFRGVDMLTT